MNKSFWLVLIGVGLLSCNDKPEIVPYENIVIRNDGIRLIYDSLPSNLTFTNTSKVLNDENGNIIIEGRYLNGFKKGEWVYHPSDTQTIKVNWSKFNKDDYSVELNYPTRWEVFDVNERPFQATFPTKSSNPDDKYFIIFSKVKDSIDMTFYQYWEHYNSVAFSGEKVKEYALFKFKTKSGNEYFFSRYIFIRGEEEILVLSFLGESGDTIYDITYSSLNEEYNRKHVIFFGIIRSLMLPPNRSRFFSPWDTTLELKEIDYPGRAPAISS